MPSSPVTAGRSFADFERYFLNDSEMFRHYWEEIIRNMDEQYMYGSQWATKEPEKKFIRVDFDNMKIEDGWVLVDGRLVKQKR